MKILALRSISKINSNVLQNSSRLFSFKIEMTPASRFSSETTDETKTLIPPPPPLEEKPQNFRYTVCQTRSSPVERPNMAGDINFAQRQTAHAAIEQQNLQPSMLPEYYQTNMERSVLLNPEPEPLENVRINQGHSASQRRFQVSKTCANATLPLKSVKLANPFPDPVKMMMSRTVSDEEKAEQMLADSKSQKNLPEWASKTPSNFRSFSTQIKRWYSNVSSDPDKCKKFGVKKEEKKKGCPNMKLKGCDPPARKNCDRFAIDPKCKKQESPYPAYSEFCHEDPDEKPSSCRMCPWAADENPNFKPQKKKFHTSISANMKRTGLEMEDSQIIEGTQDNTVVLEEVEESLEGMLCDLRKPDCERPNTGKCPPGTTKKDKESQHKKKSEKKKTKQEKPKKKASSEALEDLLNRPFLPTETRPIFSLKKREESKPTGDGACKIKKFKFPPCKQVKKEEDEVKEEKCPKKKKKRGIRDCPPSSDNDQRCRGAEQEVVEYRLMADKKDGKKKKCPEVDTSTDDDALDKDRCKANRQGTSKVCPGNLLKKKKRRGPKDKKEASELIPPVESEPDKPQRPQPTLRRI